MARRKNPQQQFLASQGLATTNSSAALALARARTPRKGVLRPPQRGPQVAQPPGGVPAQSPPGQPQAPANQFTPDAAYLAGAAQRAFDRQTALQNLTSQGDTDKSDTQEAIRRLLAQAPEQRNSIKTTANKEGLFYSGQLGKRLDTYEADLTRQQGDINLDFQRRENARIAARQAIESGMPIEEAAALAEAATRQVDRDNVAAGAGALAPTPGPAATAPKVQTGGATRRAGGKTQYKWPDGKWHSRPYRGR